MGQEAPTEGTRGRLPADVTPNRGVGPERGAAGKASLQERRSGTGLLLSVGARDREKTPGVVFGARESGGSVLAVTPEAEPVARHACSAQEVPVRSSSTTSALGAGLAVLSLLATVPGARASNHREAPITALDHKADITDLYAFVSYNDPDKATLILDVDPLLDPANGPTWFPFDPDILYRIEVDNNNDALTDVAFEFRFTTEQRLPDVYTAYAGIGQGAVAPYNSPAPVPPGTLIVPPRITSFASPGLGQRQRFTLTQVTSAGRTALQNADASPFYAVPANNGPRTMDYAALFNQGTYHLANGVSVFAGTVDDPFWIDLGATFDTANFRHLGTGVPGVLTDAEDAARSNFASDTVSGYAVNVMAIEVPIAMLTRTHQKELSTSTAATIGVWGTTSRPRVTVRRSPGAPISSGEFRQVQRVGNPLINEVVIGIGSKDRFSMDVPSNDSQFASYFLDPPIARIVNALYGGDLTIPAPPRLDLLPLVTYAPPIAAANTPAGPIADLLRLNTGVPATPVATQNRLGVIGGDAAGFPNGRRLLDDVTDIALRVVVGGVLTVDKNGQSLNRFPNNRLGDGVNVNDAAYRTTFPYVANCPSGRNRRHVDPGEPGGGPIP